MMNIDLELFLNRLMTSDEELWYLYDSERKCRSMQWKYFSSPTLEAVQGPNCGLKTVRTWDAKHVFLIGYLQNKGIKTDSYYAELALYYQIEEMRKMSLHSLLLHDNIPVHRSLLGKSFQI